MMPTEHRTGSLFKAGRFSPLSHTHVTDVLRQLLQQAGYDSHLYSSHSFRIGAVTTSAAAGLPPWLIKTLGRWNSNAYMTYICCSPHVLRWIPALWQGLTHPVKQHGIQMNTNHIHKCTVIISRLTYLQSHNHDTDNTHNSCNYSSGGY